MQGYELFRLYIAVQVISCAMIAFQVISSQLIHCSPGYKLCNDCFSGYKFSAYSLLFRL